GEPIARAEVAVERWRRLMSWVRKCWAWWSTDLAAAELPVTGLTAATDTGPGMDMGIATAIGLGTLAIRAMPTGTAMRTAPTRSTTRIRSPSPTARSLLRHQMVIVVATVRNLINCPLEWQYQGEVRCW